ncbi:hypothetical protein Tcan_00827, partial [Toxocara canis]
MMNTTSTYVNNAYAVIDNLLNLSQQQPTIQKDLLFHMIISYHKLLPFSFKTSKMKIFQRSSNSIPALPTSPLKACCLASTNRQKYEYSVSLSQNKHKKDHSKKPRISHRAIFTLRLSALQTNSPSK